jgi:dephospho-CoA kinase
MQSKIKVIGTVGQNGSGKDEVLKYLKTRYQIPFLSTGDVVRELAYLEGLELTRENLGKVSSHYFREFGKGYFVKLLAEKIRQSNWETAGISGIRSPEDLTNLKGIFGEDFILIRVFISNPRVRFDRMVKRGQGRDPQSYEQFLKQDDAEENQFSLKEVESQADYTLSNDGTLDDLCRQIDRLVYDGLLKNTQE